MIEPDHLHFFVIWMNVMNNKLRILRMFLLALPLLLSSSVIYGDVKADITPENSEILASVKYTMIGKYVAGFDSYRGEIVYDETTNKIKSVYFEMDVKSLNSNFKALDKLALSQSLLDAKNHPKIIFKSSEISEEKDEYVARGSLEVHGVKQDVIYPFVANIIENENGTISFTGRGTWVINRKDYGIYWNKYLDKGGVLVGNHVTVDWVMFLSVNKSIEAKS